MSSVAGCHVVATLAALDPVRENPVGADGGEVSPVATGSFMSVCTSAAVSARL